MKVAAVVVSYHPDVETLCRLLDRLLAQVERIVVVDNGSPDHLRTAIAARASSDGFELIRLDENLGIAAAQNIGIRRSKDLGADYVILFDQDSEPATDMVGQLLTAIQEKQAEGIRVASVGPRYRDTRQDNPPPFIQIKGLKLVRQQCDGQTKVVPVDYLIASGCLMPMEVLDDVGGMAEELFIDYVDIEWGLRAKSKGYQSFGVCGATMGHDLGDAPLVLMGRKFPLRSPLRHYYMFRNAVWLYRQGWLPGNWKLADGWRLLLKYGAYSLFAKPRLRHWLMMSKGMLHGLLGRMGRLEE